MNHTGSALQLFYSLAHSPYIHHSRASKLSWLHHHRYYITAIHTNTKVSVCDRRGSGPIIWKRLIFKYIWRVCMSLLVKQFCSCFANIFYSEICKANSYRNNIINITYLFACENLFFVHCLSLQRNHSRNPSPLMGIALELLVFPLIDDQQ